MSDEHTPTMTDPAAAPSLTRPQPVGESERIAALDVLRGFALFGIFMVNMQFFATPFMQAIFDPTLADAPMTDVLAWGFVKVFFEYKFVSLFSLMFGIGLAIQLTRAKRSGRSFYPMYLRRIFVLGLFGLVHAFLLWYGDILFFYACIGLVMLCVVHTRPRTLIVFASTAFLIGVLLMLGATVLQLLANTTSENAPSAAGEASLTEVSSEAPGETGPLEGEISTSSTPAPRGWDAIVAAQGDPSRDEWVEAETAAYRGGPWRDAFIFRAITFGYAFVFGILGFFWHIVALFLLGAALLKLDFFAPHRRSWHMTFAVVGLALGLPIEFGSAFWLHATDHTIGGHLLPIAVAREFGSVLTALGYVGVVCLLVSSGMLGFFGRALAAVGRMALTNYISQTVITTSIMYWWGLGMFGEFSRPQQVGLVISIFIFQMIFSVLWLRWFTMGPLEALWRAVTYMKWPSVIR